MNHKGFQEYKNIFTFFGDRLKRNGIFSTANKLMKYTRRYLFISKIIKYASVIIAFIETSATLIVLSTFLLISIPIAFVSMGVFSLFSLYQYKDFNKQLEPVFEQAENVMFIYAPHGYNNKKSAFLRGMAEDFRERGYLVFVVSRSFFGDRFATAHKIKQDMWVIKLNYFYVLKKKFIKNYDSSKLTYIS